MNSFGVMTTLAAPAFQDATSGGLAKAVSVRIADDRNSGDTASFAAGAELGTALLGSAFEPMTRCTILLEKRRAVCGVALAQQCLLIGGDHIGAFREFGLREQLVRPFTQRPVGIRHHQRNACPVPVAGLDLALLARVQERANPCPPCK